jgi:hypothetical protein
LGLCGDKIPCGEKAKRLTCEVTRKKKFYNAMQLSTGISGQFRLRGTPPKLATFDERDGWGSPPNIPSEINGVGWGKE